MHTTQMEVGKLVFVFIFMSRFGSSIYSKLFNVTALCTSCPLPGFYFFSTTFAFVCRIMSCTIWQYRFICTTELTSRSHMLCLFLLFDSGEVISPPSPQLMPLLHQIWKLRSTVIETRGSIATEGAPRAVLFWNCCRAFQCCCRILQCWHRVLQCCFRVLWYCCSILWYCCRVLWYCCRVLRCCCRALWCCWRVLLLSIKLQRMKTHVHICGFEQPYHHCFCSCHNWKHYPGLEHNLNCGLGNQPWNLKDQLKKSLLLMYLRWTPWSFEVIRWHLRKLWNGNLFSVASEMTP